MNRQAQAVVMFLLGGAVVKAAVSDMFLRYVKAGLQPLLIIAGVLLIMAAVMTLWYDLRPAKKSVTAGGHGDELHDHTHGEDGQASPHEDDVLPNDGGQHDDEPDDGHGHAHHEPRVGWLLILPCLGLLLVAPPALGSYAAGQSGSVLAAQNADSDYAALPKGDPVSLGVLDYASRAVFDQGRSLAGRNLQLTGFIAKGPDGQPMLARIIVSCCAADGRPIKVGLTGQTPAGLAPDTWVKVIGKYVPQTAKDPVNGAAVPYFEVTSWQQTAVPNQPYE